MMIRFVLILCILVSIVACHQKSTVEKVNYNTANNIFIDTVLVNEIRPVLDDWLTFYAISLDKFTPIDTLKVDWEDLEKNTFIYYKKFTLAEERYMPGLQSYSPDRKRLINLIEDSLDVEINRSEGWVLQRPYSEQRIYLYNRIDSTSMLLSIKDKMNLVDNTYWIDNDRFVLVGVDRRANNMMFYLELYRVHEAGVMIFCLSDSTILDKKSYLKEVILPQKLDD